MISAPDSGVRRVSFGGSDGKESACNAGDPVQSLGREDPLEKEMAAHSCILAWRIPWMEEPGRLQSTGLKSLDSPLAFLPSKSDSDVSDPKLGRARKV